MSPALPGVYVYGACCDAPNLSCLTVTSPPSGSHQGDFAHVQCATDYVMTGCNAKSSTGKSSGAAFISGSFTRFFLLFVCLSCALNRVGGVIVEFKERERD